MTSLAISLREPDAADLNFILDTWLLEGRRTGEAKHMSNDVYFSINRPRVIAILQRASVRIASNPLDAWQIFGWVAHEPGVLHYVYVKPSYRRERVATRLVEAAGLPRVATHTGELWGQLRASWGLSYDPRGVV